LQMSAQGTHSLAVSIALQSESNRNEILSDLTDQQITSLLYDWTFWARPTQLPPDWEWFCWLLLTGRGFGKTRTGAEWVISRARDGPYHPIALIAETKADARDVMVEAGESSILRCSPPWFMPDYEPSKRRVTWPNGMYGTVYSGDAPDQLRGPQHGSAWVDELAKFQYPEQTWDNMEFGLRLGERPQVVVTTTPRPIKVIKQLLAEATTALTTGSTYENLHNLAPMFIRRILEKYEGTYLGRQELHGEVLADREGALWRRADIDEARVTNCPRLARIVVGVDPPGGAAECGIVAAGKANIGGRDHVYVLEDRSLQASPDKWASEVVATYFHNTADRIVAESNFGGDMVENTIRMVNRNVPVSLMRASRGKQARAEPVAALYEQGRVHHLGQMALLEDELCTWVPDEGMPSPNRLDALVWAVTELMLLEKDYGPPGTVRYA